MKEELVVVFITASSTQEAQTVADVLLEAHLAACASIIPKTSSHYWWQGEIKSAAEALLMIKTRAVLLDAIIKSVKERHSYDVPEVIAIPIVGGSAEYLKWVENETEHKP
ncbi:MAG: divalent-cation tolerance protein CutA [Dehalococcoidia bacterium]|nr:divalent-cation tolerance protein CutA [Dehalococcoidia bacterium]